MNSFSHYSFGAVCEWMFQSLAGIDTNEAGYKHIILRPAPPGADSNPDHEPINWVKAEYDSIRGRIESSWKQMSDRFEYKVTVPANTMGLLHMPAKSTDDIMESGQKIQDAEGVKVIGKKDDRILVELTSGTYYFVSNE